MGNPGIRRTELSSAFVSLPIIIVYFIITLVISFKFKCPVLILVFPCNLVVLYVDCIGSKSEFETDKSS